MTSVLIGGCKLKEHNYVDLWGITAYDIIIRNTKNGLKDFLRIFETMEDLLNNPDASPQIRYNHPACEVDQLLQHGCATHFDKAYVIQTTIE